MKVKKSEIQLLIAVEIGLKKGTVTPEQEDKWISQMEAALASWPEIEEKTKTWFKNNQNHPCLLYMELMVYGVLPWKGH